MNGFMSLDVFTISSKFLFQYLLRNILLFLFPDKVEKVEIDLPNKKVFVKSPMPSNELLEVIQKTGKSVSYVGVKQWRL